MNAAEVVANVLAAVCIVLAGRNSVHTWWTGIAGCAVFVWVFFEARLYADVTLQLFFIVTGILGWRAWLRGGDGAGLPITRTPPRTLLVCILAGAAGAIGYGLLLAATTDAYAPIVDSVVLAGSVVGQLLLMRRRIENWWFWLLVNSVAVPLYVSRGLWLTAAFFAVYWVNALVALRHWRREMERAAADRGGGALDAAPPPPRATLA